MNICCSLSGCFSCRSNRLSKLVYALIFMGSAALGLALRYRGEEMLSSWAKYLDACNNVAPGQSSSCWGLQGCYRVSAAVCGFFFTLAPLAAIYPPSHLGAWMLKVLYFLALLFITLAMPNSFFTVYADISRYASILFMIAQVLIIVDFAYKIHEWLLTRMEKRDESMRTADWEPGCLSNGWKVLYLSLSFLTFGGAISAIGVMYKYFGACDLGKFFLSETLIIGVICTILSMLPAVSKGVLPACILFAYNTYLCYGALSNNPDGNCNPTIDNSQKNTAAIIAGVVISVLSVTWAAYSSAGNIASVVTMGAVAKQAGDEDSDADIEAANNSVAGSKEHVNVLASTRVSGSASADETSGKAKNETGLSASSYAAASPRASADPLVDGGQRASDRKPDRRAWMFHIVFSLGGLYMAMMLTNWGDESKVQTFGANPEQSVASMWVRIVTQWLIHIMYIWTLIAPLCCKNRNFN